VHPQAVPRQRVLPLLAAHPHHRYPVGVLSRHRAGVRRLVRARAVSHRPHQVVHPQAVPRQRAPPLLAARPHHRYQAGVLSRHRVGVLHHPPAVAAVRRPHQVACPPRVLRREVRLLSAACLRHRYQAAALPHHQAGVRHLVRA
jgi:hypothetical protein